MPASTYNPYIPPTGGQGPYGMVPGQIGIPNPYADLAGAFPSLGQANQLAGTDLLGQLGGRISPGTYNALALGAAQFGQGTGMPLSGLSTNQLFGNIAGFSEGEVQKGMQNYASLIPTISKTQTVDPALLTDIAARNALYAAAPDPTQAQNLAQELFRNYLSGMRGPAGGTGAPPTTGGITTPTGPADYGSRAVDTGYDPSKFDWYTSTFGKGADFSTIPGFNDLSNIPQDTVLNPRTGAASYDPFMGSEFFSPGGMPTGYGGTVPAGPTAATPAEQGGGGGYTYFAPPVSGGSGLPVAPSDQAYWDAVLGTEF